jgi:hypothetical protein
MSPFSLEEAVAGRTFFFLRTDGTLIAPALRLLAGGSIHGSSNANETSWVVQDGKLLFLDRQHRVTTSFAHALWQASGPMFIGAFLPAGEDKILHLLCDHACQDDFQPCLAMLGNVVLAAQRTAIGSTHELAARQAVLAEQTLNLIARRASLAGRKTVRCLYLVHHIEAWDSLAGLYEKMRDSTDFVPTVATLPRREPGGASFGEEPANHAGLDRLEVPHIRLIDRDPYNDLGLVKTLNPDIIFRQSPWDRDVPDAFHPRHLGFARLCYVQYGGFHLIQEYGPGDAGADRRLGYDQPYHRACWRIFSEAESQAEAFRAHSPFAGRNVVVTGHPKFDRLRAAMQRAHWPITSDRERQFRLVWAPHHSLTSGWLGFGTFLTCYLDMLAWAAADPTVEIVLKPHPSLFVVAETHGLMSATEIAAFLQAWTALPNTTTATGGDYGPLFAASDAMLTDGISFLAEYQVFDRPIVFLDSGHHVPFNEAGNLVMTATHRAQDLAEARDLLRAFRRGVPDPLAPNRPRVMRELVPFSGESVDRIMTALRTGLAEEGWTQPHLSRGPFHKERQVWPTAGKFDGPD